jgi:uncharacterized surface protein with fasciclin (FAS1) repeats
MYGSRFNAPLTADIIASALAAAHAQSNGPPPLDVTASLSALVSNNTPSAASKASSSAIISKMSAKMPNASAFLKLFSHTPASEAVGSAQVTIFAPSNEAMKGMPDELNEKLAQSKYAEHRNLFASQHLVVLDGEVSASANAHGFATANPAKSITYGEVSSSGELSASLYNNNYEEVAKANILETYQDHTTGTTIHVMSSALLD